MRWVIAITLVILAIAAGWWLYGTWRAANVGAAAMAKVVCSCVHLDARDLKSCRADDPPGFESIPVIFDAAAKTARSTLLFGLANATARYREGFGCVLEP